MFLFVLSNFGYFCMHQNNDKENMCFEHHFNRLLLLLLGVSKESKLTLSLCIYKTIELVNSYLNFVQLLLNHYLKSQLRCLYCVKFAEY